LKNKSQPLNGTGEKNNKCTHNNTGKWENLTDHRPGYGLLATSLFSDWSYNLFHRKTNATGGIVDLHKIVIVIIES